MAKLEAPQKTENPVKRSSFNRHSPGTVSNTIGTGRPAQESIVWLTIKWSFILGLVISIFSIVFYCINYIDGDGFPIDDIKTIWSIFVPIITLALGYIFGRGG